MNNTLLLSSRKEGEDILEHIQKWITHLGLSSDTFQDPNIWACDGCGCIFNTVVDDVVYLDRYVYAGDNQAEENCQCHNIPKWFGYDVGSVCWGTSGFSHNSWMCGSTLNTEFNMPTKCSLCKNNAVVFLNIPYSEEMYQPVQEGPLWSCWDHIGVSPYSKDELHEKYSSEEDRKLKRPLEDILLFLSEEPEELKAIREDIEVFITLNGGLPTNHK